MTDTRTAVKRGDPGRQPISLHSSPVDGDGGGVRAGIHIRTREEVTWA
jgi:hypothetical protein